MKLIVSLEPTPQTYWGEFLLICSSVLKFVQSVGEPLFVDYFLQTGIREYRTQDYLYEHNYKDTVRLYNSTAYLCKPLQPYDGRYGNMPVPWTVAGMRV